MAFLKNLFGKREENTGREAAAESPQSAAAENEKPAVTLDALADSIDGCKASLIHCGLSNEETEKYTVALTAMQQAIRGLHATLDVNDLYEYMQQVFTSSLTLIFSGGTPLDRDRAVKTVNESIKAIPSPAESQIRIATLQLAILTQSALIISNRRTIADLNMESSEYQAAEKELLQNSNASKSESLSDIEKITFDQYEQQIREIDAQIRGAERLISTYNQEIVSLKGVIRSIQMNPSAASVLTTQKQLQELRQKMPGLAELAAMVEKATKNSEQIRAEAKAAIRELSRKLEDTAFIPDHETEQKMNQMLDQIHGRVEQEETQAQEEEKEENRATASENRQTNTLIQ